MIQIATKMIAKSNRMLVCHAPGPIHLRTKITEIRLYTAENVSLRRICQLIFILLKDMHRRTLREHYTPKLLHLIKRQRNYWTISYITHFI